jgi:RNA polymerase sigma-70 factor (ECF subfamily)
MHPLALDFMAAETSAPADGDGRSTRASSADLAQVEALRRGDETAFTSLVQQYHSSLVRVAALYVSNHQVAQEVAQDTWLGVLRGIDRFQGHCSLRTWILRILTNRARTRAAREWRTTPFSACMSGDDEAATGPSIDPDRFFPADHPTQAGRWASPIQSWDEFPELEALSQELREHVQAAIELLPPTQRSVISLRDIEGWTSSEVCALLGITEANQRVLLHRARSRVRRALEVYVARGSA